MPQGVEYYKAKSQPLVVDTTRKTPRFLHETKGYLA